MGTRRDHACLLRTGHGMASDEMRPGAGDQRLQFVDYAGLHAPDVRDDAAAPQDGQHLGREARHQGDGRTKEDQVGVLDRAPHIGVGRINDAQPFTLPDAGSSSDISNNLTGQATFLDRQAKRSSQQAHTN